METYRWSNVEIVGGGFVTGIVFHPRQPGLIYARTDIGGAYRWEPTARRWTPLQDATEKKDWNLYGVESLGVDPDDPKRLYLAVGTYTNDWAGNGAFLRSADQGRTFQRTDLPFKLGGNEDGRGIGERIAAKGPAVWMGTRHHGLWRSDDFGAHWRQVESFPVRGRTDGVGVGIVLLHASGIYAAAVAEGALLWRSVDGGKRWKPVPGQPAAPAGARIHRAAFDRDGVLTLTLSNGPGPNGVTDGAVWSWSCRTGAWTDITPERPGGFGYAGLALDPNRPGTLYVASLDRWSRGDTIWRTTDRGKTWRSLQNGAVRDSRGAPFLNWGRGAAELGHWIAALALDPHRPGHVLYGTGATIWGSDDADRESSHWDVRAQGLEETAVLDLVSPTAGAHLLSALGDIGGFRHDRLDRAPGDGRALSPMYNTTVSLDCADNAPHRAVASGHGKVCGALSGDGGLTWQPFATEPAGVRGPGPIALSADGATIVWAPEGAGLHRSTDRGATWSRCAGVPGVRLSVAADRYERARFWAYDRDSGALGVSDDSGATFVPVATLPAWGDGRIKGAYRAPGNLWVCTGPGGLWHGSGNRPPARVPGVDFARAVGFGAPRPGSRYPAVYLNGIVAGADGLFRSTDIGATWTRLDDPAHRFGTMNVVTGDPRVYGRVFVGTNGRGILVGEPG